MMHGTMNIKLMLVLGRYQNVLNSDTTRVIDKLVPPSGLDLWVVSVF
jgi:hypothetical protein